MEVVGEIEVGELEGVLEHLLERLDDLRGNVALTIQHVLGALGQPPNIDDVAIPGNGVPFA
ncbi:hypothetical protein GCM10027040_36260 [Halomonas shantousis]